MAGMKKIKLAIAFTVLFLITGGLVVFGVTDDLDKGIQSLIFLMRGEGLTLILRGITYSANWQAVVTMCILLLLIKKTRLSMGVPVSLAVAFSTFFYHYAKIIVGRPRPETDLHLIAQGGLSFPSGHAMTGIVFYGLIFFIITKNQKKNRAEKALFFGFTGWIFLIGFSRVYLGVHYPTDILAGWLIGSAILCLTLFLMEKVQLINHREREFPINQELE